MMIGMNSLSKYLRFSNKSTFFSWNSDVLYWISQFLHKIQISSNESPNFSIKFRFLRFPLPTLSFTTHSIFFSPHNSHLSIPDHRKAASTIGRPTAKHIFRPQPIEICTTFGHQIGQCCNHTRGQQWLGTWTACINCWTGGRMSFGGSWMYYGYQRCSGIWQAKTHTGIVDVIVDAGNSIAKGSHTRGRKKITFVSSLGQFFMFVLKKMKFLNLTNFTMLSRMHIRCWNQELQLPLANPAWCHSMRLCLHNME